jgi:hypothetical protein
VKSQPTTVSGGEPIRASLDTALPTMAAALDRDSAERAFAHRFPALERGGVSPSVLAVRVAAHKPGRRCLLEYRLGVTQPDGRIDVVDVLGKIRVNRFGHSGYRLLRALWEAGFHGDHPDGVSVPEPLGTVADLQMWVQRKVPGRVVTALLDERAHETPLPERLAAAVQKLHLARVPADRRHTMADEIRILDRCLSDVSAVHPELAPRLTRLSHACERVAALLPEPQWCGSHRDFYADQVLVTETRLFMIDFDLYCEADPGLDVGNFLGHVAELSLRVRGEVAALAPFERALERAFRRAAGDHVIAAVRAYAALTLARHVFLTTRLVDRRAFTGPVLDLAEARLAEWLADGGHA